VAAWVRVPGCNTDAHCRAFAAALQRKRGRAAFPDDFVAFIRPLQERLIGKHDKNSLEGRALRALREIRIAAAPQGDAAAVELTLSFIRDEGGDRFEGAPWHELLERWLAALPHTTRFTALGVVVTLDDLTARDYVDSDALDLDYLSTRPS
jgi:hypothetical protein